MDGRGRVRVRARVAVRRREAGLPWWACWGALIAGLMVSVPGWAQPTTQTSPVPGVQGPAVGAAPRGQVPEQVTPGTGGSASVPGNGVIVPAPTAGAGASVIRPPATGTMPVIPPPGTAGGQGGVVPK